MVAEPTACSISFPLKQFKNFKSASDSFYIVFFILDSGNPTMVKRYSCVTSHQKRKCRKWRMAVAGEETPTAGGQDRLQDKQTPGENHHGNDSILFPNHTDIFQTQFWPFQWIFTFTYFLLYHVYLFNIFPCVLCWKISNIEKLKELYSPYTHHQDPTIDILLLAWTCLSTYLYPYLSINPSYFFNTFQDTRTFHF